MAANLRSGAPIRKRLQCRLFRSELNPSAVRGHLGGDWEAGISSSESGLALFVADLIGEIAGVWLSLNIRTSLQVTFSVLRRVLLNEKLCVY